MNQVRVLGVVVGVLAVALVTGVALALNSSFQTWAARRWLASHPQLHGSIGSVSAGLSRVTLQEARMESNGAVLTLPSLEAELSVPKAVFKQAVVSRLVAKGWTLDLTYAHRIVAALEGVAASMRAAERAPRDFSLLSSARAAEAVTAPVFRGILSQIQLPVDLALDGVELEGEIILPPMAGHGAVHVNATLRGGGLAVGRTGVFVLDLAGAKSDGSSLTLHSVLTTMMDSPRTFSRLATKSDVTVSDTQFPEGVKLSVDASAEHSAPGESYTIALATSAKQLLALRADFDAGAAKMAGTWKIDAQRLDFEPFALGQPLPEFTAMGAGSFETGGTFDELHATGRLTASVAHLERALPELSSIGALKLTADFDLLHHGAALRVERLTAEIANATPIASIRALQPFEFNVRTAELRVADPSQDLVGVSIVGMPLAWARPFLPGWQITNGDLRGEFMAGARNGGLTLRVKTPLTITGLTAGRVGQPWVKDVDMTLNASADYTPLGWQAEIASLDLHHSGVALLTLAGKAGQLTGKDDAVKVTGRWHANLAAWQIQPIVAGRFELASGDAQGEFTASLDRARAFETKLTVENLVAATQEKLPAITVNLRADADATGRITFKAPVVVTHGDRKSDLSLAGTFTPGVRGRVEARIASEYVAFDDLQLLLLLLPGTPPPTAVEMKNPAAPVAITPVAAWGTVDGQITLALQKVVLTNGYEVSGAGGTVHLDATALKLDGLHAAFGNDSDVKFDGTLKFDDRAPQPYALTSEATLNNFDAGAALRAIAPGRPPTIEGRVSFVAHLGGAGVSISDVIGRARGDVQVTGKSGVFRALSTDISDKIQKTGTTVSTLLSGLRAVTGKKQYTDYADKFQILTDITKALAEIPYDQLNATIVRGDNLDITLKDFTLISPEVRITGGGGIKYVDGTPIPAQPLTLDLKLGARGKLAQLIKRARLLDEKPDDLGYAPFITPIKVGGTLARPDASELGKALANSALETNGLLDRVLGK